MQIFVLTVTDTDDPGSLDAVGAYANREDAETAALELLGIDAKDFAELVKICDDCEGFQPRITELTLGTASGYLTELPRLTLEDDT